MLRLLECVPNFSEGQRPEVIRAIAAAIREVNDVKLLHLDTGYAANRTVMTFAGEPEAVSEAAFRAIKTAYEQIDMQVHKGVHPRFGATDVCPLIPISGMTMDEAVVQARKLARRVGETLDYPVFCYEEAAFFPERRNLANVRRGEYEGLPRRLNESDERPDFGPAAFRARSGATAIGAREFLLAVNFNLNTPEVAPARAIAGVVRESGRKVRQNGMLRRIPGRCPGTKAIGWYIEDFGIAQVSMNVTRLGQTPLHEAFRVVNEEAEKRGLRVTGTEIVGLVPLHVMQAAAQAFGLSGRSEQEQIEGVIRKLGLDELAPFDPAEKILEYAVAGS